MRYAAKSSHRLAIPHFNVGITKVKTVVAAAAAMGVAILSMALFEYLALNAFIAQTGIAAHLLASHAP